jgi:hypothetical protein
MLNSKYKICSGDSSSSTKSGGFVWEAVHGLLLIYSSKDQCFCSKSQGSLRIHITPSFTVANQVWLVGSTILTLRKSNLVPQWVQGWLSSSRTSEKTPSRMLTHRGTKAGPPSSRQSDWGRHGSWWRADQRFFSTESRGKKVWKTVAHYSGLGYFLRLLRNNSCSKERFYKK